MKNPHFERKRHQARQAARQQHRWPLTREGVVLYHCYERRQRTRSYWDDMAIRSGSQWLYIYWQHPRYVWQEAIGDEVFAQLEQASSPPDFDQFPTLMRQLSAESLLQVEPSLSVRQTVKGREVEIVCPEELLSAEAAVAFAQRAREYVRNPALFGQAYTGYSYSRQTYAQECLEDAAKNQ